MLSYHWAQGWLLPGWHSYLGGVLHPVHGVLRAVVVGGAPVQVELAQAVGPGERATPQHCEEKWVSGSRPSAPHPMLP